MTFFYCLGIGISTAVCSSSENEIVFTKWTGHSYVNEIFYLYAPGTTTLLYTSPSSSANKYFTRTVCVPKTAFDTYDLKWSTSSWHHDSLVEFRGIYNQIVYKAPYDGSVISLVFYSPIKKNDEWFVMKSRVPQWTTLDWVQGDAVLKNADDIANYVSNYWIYVRKVISLPSTVTTAYEITVKYKHGVVAYVNGFEVMRDNLPSGLITGTTVNTASYPTYSYRGATRNGGELGLNTAVVAIEIHGDENISTFDAYMTLYGSSWPKGSSTKVYYYPVNETLLYSTYAYDICTDYNFYSSLYSDTLETGMYFEYDIGMGQCNGFMYYVSSQYGKITKVDVQGLALVTNKWLSIMDRSVNTVHDEENALASSLYMDNYRYVRIYIEEASALPVGFSELRPIIYCATFERTTPDVTDKFYEFTTSQSIQEMVQDTNYFTCDQLSPTPIGLSLSTTCVLTGKTSAVGSYTVSMVAFDMFGPRDFTMYLSIIPGSDDEDSILYDDSYKTTPIVFTVIFCICVTVAAVVASFIILKNGVVVKEMHVPKKKVITEEPTKETNSKPQVVEMAPLSNSMVSPSLSSSTTSYVNTRIGYLNGTAILINEQGTPLVDQFGNYVPYQPGLSYLTSTVSPYVLSKSQAYNPVFV